MSETVTQTDAIQTADSAGGVGFMALGAGAADIGGEGPGSRIGHYTLIESIGEGGMGSVMLAEQTWPVRRRVAVKVIKAGMDTRQVIARFEAERQALAMMDHPNIAKVLDAGATETGRPYFVMELVQGVPITAYCDAHRLTLRERLELFLPICQAIQHAHQKGIIHRDIKPSNVLVAEADAKPLVKVIDFGIAKATADQRLTEQTMVTAIGRMIGTPHYMSPEQAEGGADVDTRSDVYSLGILLYELLTGVTPFDAQVMKGAAYHEIQRIIKEQDPPRPSTRLGRLGENVGAVAASRAIEPGRLNREMKGDLDWIVMKCLEKDRARRFETVNGLAVDVRRYLAYEPVMAGPPSRINKIRKFARRNRVLMGTSSAVFMALLIGLGLATYGFRSASKARDKAIIAEASESAQRGIAEREKARAVAGEQRATAEAGNAQASLKYLQGVLKGSDSSTVRPMLDAAAKVLDGGSLTGQPESEATVRTTLGQTYAAVGLTAPAAAQLQKALDLRRELRNGGDAPDVATALNELAVALTQKGDAAGAEKQFNEALAMRSRLAGDQTLEIGEVLLGMARLKRDVQHDDGGAVALFRSALESRRRALGANDLRLADNLRELGEALVAVNDPNAAAVELREALRIYRMHSQAKDVPPVLGRLGDIARKQKDFATAEAVYADLYQHQAKVNGDDSWVTRGAQRNLFGVMRAAGHSDAIEKALLARWAAQGADATPGDRYGVADALRHYYRDEKKTRELQAWDTSFRAQWPKIVDDALAKMNDAVTKHPDDLNVWLWRGSFYFRIGRHRDAADDYAKATSLNSADSYSWCSRGCLLAYLNDVAAYQTHARAMLERFGDRPSLMACEQALKVGLLLDGSITDIDRWSALADRLVTQNPTDPQMPNYCVLKGLAEFRRGKAEEAIKWLLKARGHTPDPDYSMVVESILARAYTRVGKPDLAAAAIARVDQLYNGIVPADAEYNVDYPFNWCWCQTLRREAKQSMSQTGPATCQ